MKLSILTLLACCWTLFTEAQQATDVRERVHLQVNSQTLLCGETLCFSAFNLSDQSGQLSKVSKILYVELIGESGRVFQQKVTLENGRGSGTYFINSLLSTGSYQLLAYTRWMKNFDDVFQLPLTIINPFESYTPPASASAEPRLSLYPQNDQLVAGIPNPIAYVFQTAEGKPTRFSAKIIHENGETVDQFTSSEKGEGQFLFKPERGVAYKIALEDEAENFHFFDLPKVVSKGYSLIVEERPSAYQVKVHASPDGPQTFQLRLQTMQSEIAAKTVDANGIVSFDKNSLPKGLLQLSLHDQKMSVASQAIVNQMKAAPKRDAIAGRFGNRETVAMELDLPAGDYSVSVRRISEGLEGSLMPLVKSAIWFNLETPFAPSKTAPYTGNDSKLLSSLNQFRAPFSSIQTVDRLPEQRNELLKGQVKNKDGQPAAKVEMAFSIPAQPYQFKTTLTDENGRFLFHFKSPLTSTNAYVKPLNTEVPLTIELEDKFLEKIPAFDYSPPLLDSVQIAEVVRRSIHSQVENAYFVKLVADSAQASLATWDPLFSTYDMDYLLDDYARFPDLKEYFTEYMIGAAVRKKEIKIAQKLYRPSFNQPQLILLDGVPVNASKILSYTPFNIRRISIMTNRVYLGPSVFDGFMSIETYAGQLEGYSPENAITKSLAGLPVPPTQFANNTGLRPDNPRPDKREQLYWNPSIKTQGAPYSLAFSTSDVDGQFLIQCDGVSDEGEAVTIYRILTVE